MPRRPHSECGSKSKPAFGEENGTRFQKIRRLRAADFFVFFRCFI
jgi:hypothetical protein